MNSNQSPEPSKKKKDKLIRTLSSSANETELSPSPSSSFSFPSLDSIPTSQESYPHEENSFEAPPLSPNMASPPFEEELPLPLLSRKIKEEPVSPEQKYVPNLGYVSEK